MKPFCPFVLALLAPAAVAQQLDWSVATPTGLVATATDGTPVTQIAAVGPLPAAGSLSASAGPSASAGTTWSVEASPTLARFSVTSQASVAPTAPPASSAAVGVHEVLLALSASSPVSVELRIAGAQLQPLGTLAGPLTVDVGDDGTLEYAHAATGPFAATLSIAATLRIRVRTGCSLATAGAASSSLVITVTPANALVVQTAVLGCIHLAPALSVTPAFAGSGVRIVADASPFVPAVLVLGLTAQPLLLPPFQATPCLVMPAPDVLLLRVDTTPVDLALPAAVRPAVVWTQSVLIAPQQLVTSAGFRILAN